MKISEITSKEVASYLRLDYSSLTADEVTELDNLLIVAKKFISDYTGIPATSEDVTIDTLDNHEDFYIVAMILCQDMYDNRTLYIEKDNLNKVIDTILGMHSINLL